MKTRAEIISEAPCRGGGFITTIIIDDEIGFTGKAVISITRPNSKRSLRANDYYWALVEKIAKDRTESKFRVHNRMLRSYGTFETLNGYLIINDLPDTQEDYDAILDKEKYHVYPTDEVWESSDGSPFRRYYLIKGSSSYDPDEMAKLIDGTIDEARNLGIETASPEEIERMKDLYAKEYRKKS